MDVFSPVKGLIKLDEISIDNKVFKLHHKATFVILIVCSLLVTSKQYIGDPIDCIIEEVPQKVMDTYCWIHSTFSVVDAHTGVPGKDYAHAGVAPPNLGDETQEGAALQYHKYYQWVCFTLFFQALCFYIPWYLWKTWEGGKVKMLVKGGSNDVGMNVPIMDEEKRKEMVGDLVSYFEVNFEHHSRYSLKFLFCEILNLINIIGQIFFIDSFLGGHFSTYGSDVIGMSEEDLMGRGDPLDVVFPKVTKCTFHKFGPSGTIEKFDGLCVLPLNIINEKIYVFLWFWFIIVACITCIHFIYRLITLFVPQLREKMLHSHSRTTNSNAVREVCRRANRGDWFLLNQLGRNMDPLIFKDFIEELAKSRR